MSRTNGMFESIASLVRESAREGMVMHELRAVIQYLEPGDRGLTYHFPTNSRRAVENIACALKDVLLRLSSARPDDLVAQVIEDQCPVYIMRTESGTELYQFGVGGVEATLHDVLSGIDWYKEDHIYERRNDLTCMVMAHEMHAKMWTLTKRDGYTEATCNW